jgi:hypothetical protein
MRITLAHANIVGLQLIELLLLLGNSLHCLETAHGALVLLMLCTTVRHVRVATISVPTATVLTQVQVKHLLYVSSWHDRFITYNGKACAC